MTPRRTGLNPYRQNAWLLPLLLAALCGPAGRYASAESVRFTFDPPTPLTYQETIQTTSYDEGPEGKGREKTVLSRSEFYLEKAGEGYAMTVQPEALKQVRAGREMLMTSNPVMKIIERAPYTYTLDADGKLVSVDGYEDVMAKVQQVAGILMEQMSQEQAAVYARNLQGIVKAIEPDVVLQRMDVEWKDRVSNLSGVELEPGETILFESAWSLTNGEALRYYTAIRFEGMERLDGKPVAKLVYRFDTDPQALSEFAGKAFDNPGAIAEAGAEVRGEGERLIDPETLLIQAETRTRTIVAELPQSDGATAKITRHEVIEYRYDYPDAVPGEEPTGE